MTIQWINNMKHAGNPNINADKLAVIRYEKGA